MIVKSEKYNFHHFKDGDRLTQSLTDDDAFSPFDYSMEMKKWKRVEKHTIFLFDNVKRKHLGKCYLHSQLGFPLLFEHKFSNDVVN